MTALNVEQIVNFRNELKENELKEMKEVFPIGDDPQFFNWIQLSKVTKHFPELTYDLKYSELEKCYYMNWYVNGVLDYYEVINKNLIKKCKKDAKSKKLYLFIRRDILGSYLKTKEFIK